MMQRLPLFLLALLAPAVSPAGELLTPDCPTEQAIDHYIDARLEQEGVNPAPPADDANILRRTMLDLVGRIPTAAETREYAADGGGDKRERLVERLIGSPAFVRHQAAEFDTLLMQGSGGSLQDYLLRCFEENRPWDEMFREMIVGEPEDEEQKGAIEFVKRRAGDLDKLVNEASVTFFGVNVSCAKCHDHPLVPTWTQDRFYGMKSFFNRTFDNGGLIGEKDYGIVDYETTDGETRTAKLMFLTGTVLDEPQAAEPDDKAKKEEKQRLEELKKNKSPPPPPEFSRRRQLVDVALRPEERHYFAKAIVNHVFCRLYGRGLVMPVDQMHPENKPSHPELLDWLARDFLEHDYDLRRLLRGLVLSAAYARSSYFGEGERPKEKLFAAAVVRPLSPRQYATSLKLAATRPDAFDAAMKPEDKEKKIEQIENSARGLAGLFDQPGDNFQVSVTEALLFANSDRVAKELLSGGGDSLVERLKGMEDNAELVETAMWNVFGRPPAPDEMTALCDYLAERPDRREEAVRQVLWALLTSGEARFNY